MSRCGNSMEVRILLKRTLSVVLLLIVSSAWSGLPTISAHTKVDLEASKIRAKVEALGISTQVEVKLRDTTKLRGRISGADADSLYIDNLAGGNTKILYADVLDVKKPSGGWGTKHWVILGSVAAGALVTWAVVKPALCDGGAQTRGPC